MAITPLVIKMVKMVQVSDEIYETLMLYKGMLMTIRKMATTFDDVIAAEINKANHFAQLMSMLIRTHPECKVAIEETAKTMGEEYFALVKPMLSRKSKSN